jgi:hypothetical protein
LVRDALKGHFGKVPLEALITASRTFPVTSRIDLERAVEGALADPKARLVGVRREYNHETLTIAALLDQGHGAAILCPLRYQEVDVGELMPARCLDSGLWLAQQQGAPFAVILSRAHQFGRGAGVHLEIAVASGEVGETLSRRFLDQVERRVREAGSYRGKVLSLESSDDYSGAVGAVKVHRLEGVTREQVILPEKTLRLLERNVAEFVAHRDGLRKLGMAAKKGLLFYGPPGTGKTHTIRYLASQLPSHTTLLITAEQVGQLDAYFQLARVLQPAMVVIEDVDLIARAREQMNSPCEESLLNRLLNEMDGLNEDAAILFVLTTNRPEQLESALSSRPGRIDQAIEFPLPDDDGRRRLVQLYARDLPVPAELSELIVRKTRKASAAFIKELMRRSAQELLRSGGSDLSLAASHVEAALDEMLLSGGSLNVKLLGGAGESSSVN